MNFLLIFIGIIIFLFALLVIYNFWLQTKLNYHLHKKFPGPKSHLIVGNISDIILLNPALISEQTFQLGRRWAKQFKTTYSLWWNGSLALNVIVGKDVEQFINSSKCLNKSIVYDYLHPFMGTGLLTSGGRKWQQRRKILTPAFHFNILQQFHKTFQNEANQLIESIKNNDNKLIHAQDCFARFSLNTVCETAMGIKLDSTEESNKYQRQIYEIGEMMVYRLMRPWLLSNLMCKLTGYTKKLNEIIIPVHNFTRQIINKRRQMFQSNQIQVEIELSENIYETKKVRYAMLDTLLDAEARGQDISSEGIREEVDTFMFEGLDTTTAALTFTLFLLAENQDIQQKLFEEIQEFAKKQNIDEVTANDFNQLKYLDRVLKESLRIYPPVPFISRVVSEEIQFNDVILPVNTIVNCHIYDLHHDDDHFPDPEKFDPDRFLPEEIKKRHPFAYIPFSSGQRNCIGQKFALLEIKTMLVKLILNFQLEQVTKRNELVFIAGLVLRTKNPIMVKFNLRQ